MLSLVCRHAPMLLPSGWPSGAEAGRLVAVESLAKGTAQGFKFTQDTQSQRDRYEGSDTEGSG